MLFTFEWKNAFESLVHTPTITNDVEYSELLYSFELTEFYGNEYLLDNLEVNSRITVQEVELATRRLKLGKAVGYDTVPNEVIKHPQLLNIFTEFFNTCFDKSYIPNVWHNAIINPIPKGRDKDPLVP